MSKLIEVLIFIALALGVLCHAAQSQPCDSASIKRDASQTCLSNPCYDFISKVILPEYNRRKEIEIACDSILVSYAREMVAKDSVNSSLSRSLQSDVITIDRLARNADSLANIASRETNKRVVLENMVVKEKEKGDLKFWKGIGVGAVLKTVIFTLIFFKI